MTQATPREAPVGRDRLVREAFVLFAEKGFDSVTVRDIAAASGVSVGLINHHFGSKDGLREAVDEFFIAQFEDAITGAAAHPEATTPEDHAKIIDGWIARHEKDWPTIVAYFRRALLEESDWGFSVFQRFYGFVQSSVMRMDAAGQLAPDVDRLWLPFLMMYLELGTMVFDPYVKRVLGRSGYERDLWQRRHRAYMTLIRRGSSPKRAGL
ncbi:MAG: TetR/AcrR family transcriptional regulator [Phenylobacterium sp.]|uniref:TetR/AcrR family transcriptional regulator n=1 Tax=Phenylobacterium sp. TaxID=1871053 RepID=UPI001A3A4017|nr:TetR/AcrR family transcriptional regulator [Phenylobacterium sp.]MBL8772988.1 TetR/AcrR family transcriptional regulator [Phenylobacterium sp.]